ncbi:hypothetical protein NMY22_g14975 [Coprinellus aureogranulatus]|nr:hypothetical protein NMY22_g14975 [Coprinellus aureogranulatus]
MKGAELEALAAQARSGSNDKVYCRHCFAHHREKVVHDNQREQELHRPLPYLFNGSVDDYRTLFIPFCETSHAYCICRLYTSLEPASETGSLVHGMEEIGAGDVTQSPRAMPPCP